MRMNREKSMKKIISLLCAIILALSGIVASACEVSQQNTTETQAILWGDVDNDGILSILDATYIQRYLVGFTVSSFNKEVAIVSDSKELSIMDATLIQQKLCSLIARFPVEENIIQPTESEQIETQTTEKTEMKMLINSTPVIVEWEDNESVTALKEAVKNSPLIIQMSMYGGFEQVGSLGITLPRKDSRITTSSGDVILYSGNQMVVFYGSNTWAYTRLGHITDKTSEEMRELLSNGNVTITLSY